MFPTLTFILQPDTLKHDAEDIYAFQQYSLDYDIESRAKRAYGMPNNELTRAPL